MAFRLSLGLTFALMARSYGDASAQCANDSCTETRLDDLPDAEGDSDDMKMSLLQRHGQQQVPPQNENEPPEFEPVLKGAAQSYPGCTDTPGWHNGYTDCKNEVGWLDPSSWCDPNAGWSCDGYQGKGFCENGVVKDFAGGAALNYAEHNCCGCGKQNMWPTPPPAPTWNKAPCCYGINGKGPCYQFCSPNSGNCYGGKNKDYYQWCGGNNPPPPPVWPTPYPPPPPVWPTPTPPKAPCCYGIKGKGACYQFCSPNSGNCYGSKNKDYYQWCGGGSPTPPWHNPTPQPGSTYQIKYSYDSRYCLSVKDNNANNGVDMQLWSCSHGSGQLFQVPKARYPGPLRLNMNPSKCVTVEHDSGANGQAVHVWDCVNDYNQNWQFDSDPNTPGLIRYAPSTNYCMVVDGNRAFDGAKIQLWSCNDGASYQKQWITSW